MSSLLLWWMLGIWPGVMPTPRHVETLQYIEPMRLDIDEVHSVDIRWGRRFRGSCMISFGAPAYDCEGRYNAFRDACKRLGFCITGDVCSGGMTSFYEMKRGQTAASCHHVEYCTEIEKGSDQKLGWLDCQGLGDAIPAGLLRLIDKESRTLRGE